MNNEEDNITNNNFKTIDTNNTQSSINSPNINNLRTISAQKHTSHPSFRNNNKNKTKKKNIGKNFDQYESNKEKYEEKYTSENEKILSLLTKNKTTDKLKNYISIDINELYKHNNKNLINLDRFNNSFRVQMNNTCYKFIPFNHLKKLNELQRDNIIVRKSMEKLKDKIDTKIQDFKDKKLLLKKYQKVKTKLRNDKNRRILSARKLTTYPDKIPNNIIFPPGHFFLFGFKTRALYEHHIHSLENEKHRQRLIKIEKKNEPQKNIKINDSLMDKALKKLNNSLSVKNIKQYIDDMKKEKICNKKEIENKYFPNLKEAKNCIKKFDINKMNKKYEIKDKSKGFLEIDEDDIELEDNIFDIENDLRKLRL